MKYSLPKTTHLVFVILLASVSFAGFTGVAHAIDCNYYNGQYIGFYGPYSDDSHTCASYSGVTDTFGNGAPIWDSSYIHFDHQFDYCIGPGSAGPTNWLADFSPCYPPPNPPPSCTLTASPSSILVGQQSVLSWTTSGNYISYAYIIPTIGQLYVDYRGGSASVSPSVTTTYTETAYDNNGGIGQCSASVTVVTPVNGACSSPQVHYTCSAGTTSVSNVSGATSYTWGCNGLNGGTNTSATACSQNKTLPDLTAGSVSPVSATTGTAVSFSATVSNIGNATTGAGFTNLFQKATAADGTGATDIGTAASAVLSAIATAPAALLYTFPSADGGTTRYMRACADKSSAGNVGVITEPQASPNGEFNNCGAWTPITVSWAACGNSANNPPTCNACTIPLVWNGSGCVTPASCPATTTGGTCDVLATVSGGSSGSCHTGYSGSCSYTCTNGSWGAPSSNSCAVPPPPAATISANPTRVRSVPPNNTSTVFWTVTNTTCNITKNGAAWKSGLVASGNSVPAETITSQTVYTITCTGVTPQSVTVNVLAGFQEF